MDTPKEPASEPKGARGVRLLREAADAYDELPAPMRSHGLLGPWLQPDRLRAEADAVERRVEAWREVTGL
jgi:hypothetical protein